MAKKQTKKPTKQKEESFLLVDFAYGTILKFTESRLKAAIRDRDNDGYDLRYDLNSLRILNSKLEIFTVEEQPVEYKLVKLKQE